MASEIGDMWKDVREHRKRVRWGRVESVPQALARLGIEFTSKNNGVHLIVTHGSETVDFWPGSGLWIYRSGRRGRGFNALVATLQGGA